MKAKLLMLLTRVAETFGVDPIAQEVIDQMRSWKHSGFVDKSVALDAGEPLRRTGCSASPPT